MFSALCSLNYVPVLVVAIAGFILGWLWYSPVLFAKAWMTEMKLTEEDCKQKGGMAGKMIKTFLLTVVSTITLDVLISAHGSHGALLGAKFGLFVGVGLIAARQRVNSLFDGKSCRLFMIIAGYDVALCVLQGAILGVWR